MGTGGGDVRVAIVGAGAVGTAVGRALFFSAHGGYRVAAVASRTLASAARAVAAIGAAGARATTDAADAARGADVVFVTTSDGAIATVARALAAAGVPSAGALAVHCSGALTAAEALAPLAARGVAIGSLHPLQTFARSSVCDPPDVVDGGAAGVAGAFVACEGDDAATARLERLARDMGATPFRVRPEAKPLYHASAALASNAVVALVSVAAKLLAGVGLGEERALEALLPLVRGAVANLGSAGLPGALTGPIARGDADVVRRHVEGLALAGAESRAALAVYAALAEETIALAKRKGTLMASAEAEIRELLSRAAAAFPPTATSR